MLYKNCKIRYAPLEVSLASQKNLSSVAESQEEADLHKEVFDYIPGTVNTKHEAWPPISLGTNPSNFRSKSGLGTGH